MKFLSSWQEKRIRRREIGLDSFSFVPLERDSGKSRKVSGVLGRLWEAWGGFGRLGKCWDVLG